MAARTIKNTRRGNDVLEGAGVRLTRVFGSLETTAVFDPFLLLDDFHSNNPEDYVKGFPWHPHRGIETFTYVLEGEVTHMDSLGNSGVIGPGDVQWMTAGSGIIHQEMPRGSPTGAMWGFQLWANLPASHKMITPRYRGFAAAEIPQATTENGSTIKVICGAAHGVSGPVNDVVTAPLFLDVDVPANASFQHDLPPSHTVFAYVIGGSARFDPERQETAQRGDLVLYNDGDQVSVGAGSAGVRFLLVAGQALREPVAWQGPIVMNTREEIATAFREFRDGTFVKT